MSDLEVTRKSSNATRSDERLSVYELGWVDLHVKHRPQFISGLCTIAGEVPFNVILRRIRAFLVKNTRYQYRLVFSRSPSWHLDPAFQVENHVSTKELPIASIDHVIEHIGALLADTELTNRPPWRVVVYRSVDSLTEIKTAIAFCAHHSVTDGLGARKLFEAILDGAEEGISNGVEVTNAIEGRSVPSRGMNVLQFGLSLARDFLLKRLEDPFSGATSSARRVLEFTWSRGELKHARRAFGCSLQELLLLIITRSLEKYGSRRGRLGKLRAIVPMADMAAARSEQQTALHDIGYLDLPLGLTLEQQFMQLRMGVTRLQKRLDDGVFGRLSRLLAILPGIVRYHAAHRWSNNANLLISLVPGIVLRPTICGMNVTAIYGLPAIAPGQAIAIGLLVTRDKVHVALVLDPSSVPDHDLLAIDLENSLLETLATVRDNA